MKKPRQYTFAVSAAQAGERLDKAICAAIPDLSRSRVQALLELGCVSADLPTGSVVIRDASAKVKPGQMFTVIVPEIEVSEIKAQAIALDIVYEDAHLLVINKEAGMTVHPAPGSPDSTLVNALLAHCKESLSGIGGVARPGIVHRIDKETSGLLVVAKHDNAHQSLSKQLETRTLKRTYMAVVAGVPVPAKGTITGNIGRHPKDRQRMAVLEDAGKHAVTHYTVKERFGDVASLVECNLETGRTHQIRVHFAHIRHPLIGDPVYGRRKQLVGANGERITFARQALHAFRLGLIHPDSGKAMEFEAKLPEDFESLVAALRH